MIVFYFDANSDGLWFDERLILVLRGHFVDDCGKVTEYVDEKQKRSQSILRKQTDVVNGWLRGRQWVLIGIGDVIIISII